MTLSGDHISNINRTLKNIKSKVIVDYICLETIGITIISNVIVSQSNLQIMERYIKNIENIRSDDIQVLKLS